MKKSSDLAERLMKLIFCLCAWLCAGIIVLIALFLLVQSLPAFEKIGVGGLLFGTQWKPSENEFGLLPMICGTFSVTLLAAAIGAPLGILCALFMAYFCPKSLKPVMRTVISLMAGIPSVVYGFFGLVVIVPLIRQTLGGGMSILAAGLLLGMMILPTVAELSLSSIEAAPASCYQGSLALGASPEYSVFRSVLPAARKGVVTAVVLGLGRAVGETMAVMMVAGNQAVFPESILSGVRTLTSNIALEMGYAADLHRQALVASAVVLLVMILITVGILMLIRRKENTAG